MNQIISFFMSVIMTILSIFNISFSGADLEPVTQKEAVATKENIVLFRTIFETETAWLASLQLENGAIPMTFSENGELKVNPYFSDFAALALLDNAEKYALNVKKYIDWHFEHLNTADTDYNGIDGTIYDYTITMTDGKITDEQICEVNGAGYYDSTDSYAATFLTLLNKYYTKTNDSEYILSHSKDIERVANAMLATMDNGLTYAKPDYEVKYLMDNCEVYQGSISAKELFEKVICLNNESYNNTLKKCSDAAEKIKKSVNENLWNPISKHYIAQVNNLGIPTSIFSWKNYYPDATSQLFPITCGVIEPNTERANTLYNKFCESYKWENFDIPDDFYWGSNVYAAALMNDLDRTVIYMTEYSTLLEHHNYPLYNADSAKVAMAAYIMLQKNS